jgi:hypothetical protein
VQEMSNNLIPNKGLDKLTKQEAALQAKLKAVMSARKAIIEKQENTRNAIIAEAVLAHIAKDPKARDSFARVLNTYTKEANREYIADLLTPAAVAVVVHQPELERNGHNQEQELATEYQSTTT